MSKLEHLNGKKILFFCVQSFNLEKDIVNQLQKHGALVTYYDERPANNNFTKGIIRLNRNFLKSQIVKYYKRILKNLKDQQFDYLFVNRGEVVPEFFLKEFMQTQDSCKNIFYTWDSFQNNGHCLSILKYFDKKMTFDHEDAEKYDLEHRPLYFTDKYRKIYDSNQKKVYNLLFLGTAHSDRYLISTQISDWCNAQNLTSYCYYYMQGRLVYFFKKYFDKSFQMFDYSKLSFNSLNLDQIVDFYDKSEVILDISHPYQSGLTMRTFEAIGAGKKLITTNVNIKKYPFYNENNIFLIDRHNIQLDINFFKNKYLPLSFELYESYSIDGWLYDIFK
ncbi:lipopolysaccharide biosynthesis protein [Acinetobacter sp. TGL-Y2]|uniref:lipopolysaccharide biosynthesis protein n=1 Tax=Acinetobacter sp. TGL-Y2 TaxID=1407071 RepID=UPI0007A65B0D|nr:lipopolysaccharide biosynthesis protein [Acinetobacter sp. TGL-Y2]AMW77524.1 lipopolysaccharide biosynthesis protein [Acinetobacter sp. TGL-Y2]